MKLRGPPGVGTMDHPGVTGRCPGNQAAADIESLRKGLPQWFPVTETPLTEPTASEPSETEVPPPSRRRLPKLPLPQSWLGRPQAGRPCQDCAGTVCTGTVLTGTDATLISGVHGSQEGTFLSGRVPPAAAGPHGGCPRNPGPLPRPRPQDGAGGPTTWFRNPGGAARLSTST